MGHFQAAFASVLEAYGTMFQMVTYDAGALSEANASAVVAAGKDYLFALKGEQRTMFKMATELLDRNDVSSGDDRRIMISSMDRATSRDRPSA